MRSSDCGRPWLGSRMGTARGEAIWESRKGGGLVTERGGSLESGLGILVAGALGDCDPDGLGDGRSLGRRGAMNTRAGVWERGAGARGRRDEDDPDPEARASVGSLRISDAACCA